MIIPISPSAIAVAKLEIIPDFVILSVNELLTKKYTSSNGIVVIYQEELVDLAKSKMPDDTKFDIEWLNFEALYDEYGWNVIYVKGDYTGVSSHFKFRKKT